MAMMFNADICYSLQPIFGHSTSNETIYNFTRYIFPYDYFGVLNGYYFSCSPAGKHIDVKKSSFKKVQKFLMST